MIEISFEPQAVEAPVVYAGLPVRYRSGGSAIWTVQSVLSGWVTIQGWSGGSRFPEKSFWEYFEPVGPADRAPLAGETVKSALKLVDEIQRIDLAMDQLVVSYSNAGRSRHDAHSSKLFRALNSERDDLRKLLVAIG